MRSLTPAEKAALYFQILENVQDWKIIYRIAIGEKHAKSLKDSTIQANTSKWKESDRIKNAVDEIKRYFYFKRQDIEKEIKESISKAETETTNRTTKNEIAEKTNFLNLDEFLQYANQQANSIADEKERRAWVEMIGKYMNFKESEEGETEQIKAYLPIQCYSCELRKRCEACKYDICPVEV